MSGRARQEPAASDAAAVPPSGKRKAGVRPEVVVITGLSGSGKGSVLRSLEDLGFYSVDNLPVDLIPKFAELTRDNPSIQAAALVVDIREGEGLNRFPHALAAIRKSVDAKLIFLEADESALVRRFSETRRPHPLGGGGSIVKSIRSEKRQLGPIRAMAELGVSCCQRLRLMATQAKPNGHTKSGQLSPMRPYSERQRRNPTGTLTHIDSRIAMGSLARNPRQPSLVVPTTMSGNRITPNSKN